MSESNYWQRLQRRRLTRRTMLGASAKAGVGAAGLALVGCGDDDDDQVAAQVTPTPAQQAEQAAEQVAQQAEQAAPAEQAEPAEQAVAEAPGGPQRGGFVRTYDLTDPLSFDQFATFGYQAFLHGHMTYPKLTHLKVGPNHPTVQFEPELWLAESFENPDPLEYTFFLQPNAVWEDVAPTHGRPVDAEDVAFTFGEPYQAYPNRAVILPSLNSVEAVEEKTVRFSLKTPLFPMLLYVGHQAGPHIYAKEFPTYEDSRNRPISAAAWRFVTYDVGSRVLYERNPDYWDADRVYLDEVEFVFINDPSSQVAAMRSGQIDFYANEFFSIPPPEAADLIKEFPNHNWEQLALQEAGGVTVDIGTFPFNDARARQAVSSAMDREGLLAVADSLGVGKAMSALPPMDFWWDDPLTSPRLKEFYEFNPQRANNLLDAVEGAREAMAGVDFNTNSGYGPLFVGRSQLIQQLLKDVGLDLNLVVQDNAEYYSVTFPGKHEGKMGDNRMVGTTEPDEPLTFIYSGVSPRSGIPHDELLQDDQTIQDLLVKQRQETDRDARKAIIDDFVEYLATQMYLIPKISPLITVFAREGMEDVFWTSTFAPEPQFRHAWLSDL